MKKVTVIGMGVSKKDLTARHLKCIAEADVLVGGKRLLAQFEDTAAEKKPIDKDIRGTVAFIRCRMATKTVVVLASGDPLYFGIGKRLVEALGGENVVIYPNVSTVGAAFARIQEPWNDVKGISLHGRGDLGRLFHVVDQGAKVVVFTDPKRNPAWLARKLLEKGLTTLKMCVFEALGTPSERVGWYGLEAAAGTAFADPNLVYLKPSPRSFPAGAHPHLGMPDAWFEHEGGLITKAEVRAVTLSKLRLGPNLVLWDLGAGSGSVAVEAALLTPGGRVIAVEKDPRRIAHIEANKKRFGIDRMEILQAVLPAGLEDLPGPDRIFIGGGGFRLKAIIDAAVPRLRPGGVVVINTVLLVNVQQAVEALFAHGINADLIQVQVSRGQAMPWGQRLKAGNPVWIISGTYQGKGKNGD